MKLKIIKILIAVPIVTLLSLHLMKSFTPSNDVAYEMKGKFSYPEIRDEQLFSEVVDSVWVDKFGITHKTFK